MVKLIEDQIHQFFINKEEERCLLLEQQYNNNEKTKNKKYKRKKITKPWKRPGPNALCKKNDLLILVKDYDYNLLDKDFQEYCFARGYLHIPGEIGSRRWEYFLKYNKSKSEYMNDHYFQFAQEVNDKCYKYTNKDMELWWKIIELGRAKLQDCWELFRK